MRNASLELRINPAWECYRITWQEGEKAKGVSCLPCTRHPLPGLSLLLPALSEERASSSSLLTTGEEDLPGHLFEVVVEVGASHLRAFQEKHVPLQRPELSDLQPPGMWRRNGHPHGHSSASCEEHAFSYAVLWENPPLEYAASEGKRGV